MHSRRSSKRLSQDTRPIGFEAALLQRQPASLRRVLDGGKKNLIGTFPDTDLRTFVLDQLITDCGTDPGVGD